MNTGFYSTHPIDQICAPSHRIDMMVTRSLTAMRNFQPSISSLLRNGFIPIFSTAKLPGLCGNTRYLSVAFSFWLKRIEYTSRCSIDSSKRHNYESSLPVRYLGLMIHLLGQQVETIQLCETIGSNGKEIQYGE